MIIIIDSQIRKIWLEKKEGHTITKKTMKTNRYYIIKPISDQAIRCEEKHDGFGEGRYRNRAIGFVSALSSGDIINGSEFNRVIDYITHGCYENAKLDLKHILIEEAR